jgi:putative DNA primase/helicase
MINEFKNAMVDAGIEPPLTINADGVLHRFKINGKDSGWYVLHGGNYYAGAFGDWRFDLKVKWKQLEKPRFTRTNKAEIEKRRLELIALENEKHKKAAEKSRITMGIAGKADQNHPYLVRKKITYAIACQVLDRLVLPIVNFDFEIVGAQYILPDGKKLFETGQQKKGCFIYIDGGDQIIICEGWATGVTLNHHYMATVLVALDCGNLKNVAIGAKKHFMNGSDIIIAADNDESGIGERKAIEAAIAISCDYIIPPVIGDFNDYLV